MKKSARVKYPSVVDFPLINFSSLSNFDFNL